MPSSLVVIVPPGGSSFFRCRDHLAQHEGRPSSFEGAQGPAAHQRKGQYWQAEERQRQQAYAEGDPSDSHGEGQYPEREGAHQVGHRKPGLGRKDRAEHSGQHAAPSHTARLLSLLRLPR